jgi:copper transport protein
VAEAARRTAAGIHRRYGAIFRRAIGSGHVRLACLPVALIAVLWLALTPPALAHLAFVSSEPAGGARLETSPERIVLTFTQTADAAASRAVLLDAAGEPLGGGALELEGAGRRLTAELSEELAPGRYRVEWRALSADGHVVEGAFGFRVSRPPSPTERATPLDDAAGGSTDAASPGAGAAPSGSAAPGTDGAKTVPWTVPQQGVEHGGGPMLGPGDESAWVRQLQGVGRWVLYVGLVLLAGALTAAWLLRGRPLQEAPPRSLLLVTTGAAAAGAGLALMTYAQARIVGAPRLMALYQTLSGEMLLTSAFVVYFGIGAAFVAMLVYPHRFTLTGVGVAAAVAMLVRVLGGHAVESGLPALSVVAQWTHLLGVGAWIGGLVWLLLMLRARAPGERAPLVLRFSALAGVGLGAVALTGLLRTFFELGSIADLLDTDYGVTLLVKIAAFGMLAALGARSRFRLMPRLVEEGAGGQADGTRALDGLRWGVRAEVALALLILALVAVLTGLAPPGAG